MGKYAANPECGICRTIGELCLSCAGEWKAKQFDDELKALRQIAKLAPWLTTIAGCPKGTYFKLAAALERVERIRKRKPRLKPKAVPLPTNGQEPKR